MEASFVWADKGENSSRGTSSTRSVRESFLLPSPTVTKNPLLPLSVHDHARGGKGSGLTQEEPDVIAPDRLRGSTSAIDDPRLQLRATVARVIAGRVTLASDDSWHLEVGWRSMPIPATKIRIFLASPGDVRAEREQLAKVVQELNTTLSVLAPEKGIVVELVFAGKPMSTQVWGATPRTSSANRLVSTTYSWGSCGDASGRKRRLPPPAPRRSFALPRLRGRRRVDSSKSCSIFARRLRPRHQPLRKWPSSAAWSRSARS